MSWWQAGSACALVTLCAAAGGKAQAEIVGGMVNGGTSGGTFVELVIPPPAAGPDVFESPDLIAFNEEQDLVLLAPLPVGPGRVLGVGSFVSSHYVSFDPGELSTIAGYIDFDEPIIGLLINPVSLDATAGLLGAPLTSYSIAPGIGPDPQMDTFRVALNMPNRLLVEFGANSPGDQLRVLTGVAVPEPTTALLLGVAVVGFAARPAASYPQSLRCNRH
ncbi:PEP-CTERM sorting domain-containing protein [Botrimarina sp.]|uniref:PEP-CTERM sorting domain-containing protein n=1 Tax=Botrimarina sp. TaxID=2795802 RepID=UPI0032ED38C7